MFHYDNEIRVYLFILAMGKIPNDIKCVRKSHLQTLLVGIHMDTVILVGNLIICMKSLSVYAFEQTILLPAIYS